MALVVAPSDPTPDPDFDLFWLDRATSCELLLGCSREFLRVEIIPKLGANEKRRQTGKPGRPWQFWAPALVRILGRHVTEQRRRRREAMRYV